MAPMEEFIEMLKSHNRIVFFGGAGVSTESDIPDFRGKGGLYRQKTELPWSPEEMLSHHFYAEHPVEFFTLYKEREGMMLEAEPNRAHTALVELEKMGKLSAVVTQNIDGLHQKAGSKKVIELHGSVELGPVIGLSDVILDIVESGSTLRANGLTVLEDICDVSARLVVNRVAMKTKRERIRQIIDGLGALLAVKQEGQA